MKGVTYDAGALVAGERGDRRLWALHRRALEQGQIPTVPAGVLGQVWRGGPQPMLSRLLAGCEVEPLEEPLAREGGQLLARAGAADIVDASVVAGARARGDAVVTSDRSDLRRLDLAAGGGTSIIVV